MKDLFAQLFCLLNLGTPCFLFSYVYSSPLSLLLLFSVPSYHIDLVMEWIVSAVDGRLYQIWHDCFFVKSDLSDHVVTEFLGLATEAAAKRVNRLERVFRSGRMRNTKRTVDSTAVLDLWVTSVTVIAIVSHSTAEERLAAAKVALPGDKLMSMFFARVVPDTDPFRDTVFAEQVFLLGGFFEAQISFTVGLPSVEWTLTLPALVKGAFCEKVGIFSAEKSTTFLSHWFHVQLVIDFDLISFLQDLSFQIE